MKVYTTDKISLGGHSLDVAWVEGLSSANVNLGVTAHGWGNHADAEYLTALPSHNHDTLYLGKTAKAADSNLLDGINSTQFLRSDASDTHTATLTVNGQFIFNSSTNSSYREGIRLNISTSGWGGGVFGGARDSTSGVTDGWWVARNPSKDFVIAYGTSSNSGGLYLPYNSSALKYKDSRIWNASDFSVANVLNSNVTPSSIGALASAGKAADSELLDGINSTSFLRSDQDYETSNGRLTMKGGIGFPAYDGATYSRGSDSYGIYQESGAWSSPYPDLNIGFHTGISIGAHPTYGGVRFFSNSDMLTQIMSVGNSADGLGAGYVYVNAGLVAGTSLRAPAFYDTSNTSYYLNPASDSNLYRGKFRANDQADNDYTLAALWTQNYDSGPAGIAFHISGNVGKLLEMRTNGILYWNNSEVLTTSSGYLPLSGGTLTGDITVGSGQTSSNIYMADSNGTARRIHTNSSRIGFLTSSNGWGSYCFNNGDWKTDMISYAGVSMRAPIFYDTDDTGYYLSPASTSNLNSVNTNIVTSPVYNVVAGNNNGIGFWTDQTNYTIKMGNNQADHGTVTDYSMHFNMGTTAGRGFTFGSSRTAVAASINALTGAANFSDEVTITPTFASSAFVLNGPSRKFKMMNYGNQFYIQDSTMSTNRLMINGDGYVSLNHTNPSEVLDVAGNGIFSGSLKSTSLYDVDDTTYYLNPAYTSNLKGLIVSNGLDLGTGNISVDNEKGWSNSGGWTRNQTPYGYISLGPANTGHAHIYTDRSNFYFNKMIQVLGGSQLNQNDIRSKVFYDIDNTGYYLNPASTSNLNVTNTNTLNVSGNTTLGNGNGDVTHINDILHVGATDSGNSDFYFGEGSTNAIAYGAHWNWDSGYRFTWNTRNSNTDTMLMYYDTNNLTYLTLGRSLHMNNKNIDYVSQLHFNDNVRLYDEGNDSYLNFKYGDANAGGIIIRNGGGTQKGMLYADNSGFGLLDNDGAWALRTQTGTNPLELRCDNNVEFQVYNSYTNSPGSSRAPIFYDSNNTGYYTNPASTSVLNTLDLRGRFLPDATGDYDATAITSLTNAPIYFDELNVGTTNTYIPAFHMRSMYSSGYRTHMNVGLYKRASAWGDNDTGFYVALGGSDSYPTKHWKLTYGHSLYNSEGYVSTPGSFRAPIFYDSDNTSYYMDPSNSNIAANFSGGIQMTGNYGVGITGKYTSTRLQTIFNMGTSYKLPNDGLSTSNAYGLYWSHQNAGATGGANNLASHGLIILEAGNYKGSWGGGRIVTTESVRAPIFYDSNNTGYYVNPASTSNLNVLTLAGTATASNFILSSDERKKTKIKDLERNNINANWKSFEMKNDEGEYRTGVIAQELEETHPEFVNTDPEGFKSVKYIDLLIAKIAELEARLEKAGI